MKTLQFQRLLRLLPLVACLLAATPSGAQLPVLLGGGSEPAPALPRVYYTYEFGNTAAVPIQVSFVDDLPDGLVWNSSFAPLIENPIGSILGGSTLDELVGTVTYSVDNKIASFATLRVPPGISTLTLSTTPTTKTGTFENDATITFGSGGTVQVTAKATLKIDAPAVPAPPCTVILDSDVITDKLASVVTSAAAHGISAKALINKDSPTNKSNPWLKWSQLYPGDIAVLKSNEIWGDIGWFQLPTKNPWSIADFLEGTVAQNALDPIEHLTPLNARLHNELVGKLVVAVIYDLDLEFDKGEVMNLKGNRLGRLAFTVLAVEAGGVRVRIEPPVATGAPVPVPCCSDRGLEDGHIDVDTSTFIAAIGTGVTGFHVHAYDDKNDTKGIDYLNMLGGLTSLNAAITNPAQKFKLIIANADLSPGARLVVNKSYVPGDASTFTPGTVWDNTALSALPVFSLGGVAGTTKLSALGLQFAEGAILGGGLLPTTTFDLKANTPGKKGEWRNGAFTIQAVAVNAAGTDAFTTNTSRSNGGVQGVATSGLLWESTVFNHWEGVSYHLPANTFVPGVPVVLP